MLGSALSAACLPQDTNICLECTFTKLLSFISFRKFVVIRCHHAAGEGMVTVAHVFKSRLAYLHSTDTLATAVCGE